MNKILDEYIKLELERWRLHRTLGCMMEHGYVWTCDLPIRYWWIEYGAFVSILPRQCGKTSRLLKSIADEFVKNNEDYILVVPASNVKDHCHKIFGKDAPIFSAQSLDWSYDIDDKKTNLLVDEFCYIDAKQLHKLLSKRWSSVTMVSTLLLK